MTTVQCTVFSFSDVVVWEAEHHVTRGGQDLTIEPKAFRVLVYLLHHAGHVIPKEELLDAVWGDASVTENSLTRAIALLRKLLQDDPRDPRFIETVSTVGYRFICPVAAEADGRISSGGEAEAGGTTGAPSSREESPGRVIRRRWITAVAITVASAIAIAVWHWYPRYPAPRVAGYALLTHDGRHKQPAAADRTRLYINVYEPPTAVEQMPVTGGEIVPIPLNLPGADEPVAGLSPNDVPHLLDISSDESSLLVSGPSYSLWATGVMGSPVRHLGTAQDAAWSPDGRFIVYSWLGELFVAQSDGSHARVIVSTKTSVDSYRQGMTGLSWSPDGARIRFSREHKLWEISPSGSDLHELLPGWRSDLWQCCGRWTADGHFFIFLAGGPSSNEFIGGDQIWAIDERRSSFRRTTPAPVQLTQGPIRWGDPVPSWDGKKIFARGVTLKGELVRYDAEKKQWNAYLGGRSAESVSFSRDAKSILYASFPEGTLWRANADGSAPVQLTDPPLVVYAADWCPDGSRIVFNAAQGNKPIALYVISSNGGQPVRLLPDDISSQTDPSWDPEGNRIVYASGIELVSGTPAISINILDLRTHVVTSIPGSEDKFSPRWSPDGRFIAALRVSDHKLSIYDLQSQRWRTLYNGFANFPTWSRDGNWIYFQAAGMLEATSTISRASVVNARVEAVADMTGFRSAGYWGAWIGFDPDNTPLSLRDAGVNEIYALTFEH